MLLINDKNAKNEMLLHIGMILTEYTQPKQMCLSSSKTWTQMPCRILLFFQKEKTKQQHTEK